MAAILVSRFITNLTGLCSLCAASAHAVDINALREIFAPYPPPNRRTLTFMLEKKSKTLVLKKYANKPT